MRLSDPTSTHQAETGYLQSSPGWDEGSATYINVSWIIGKSSATKTACYSQVRADDIALATL